MDLDLRLVRYAVTLAEELNYTRAAARLHIAQQTLSTQISHLEDRIGSTLFLRNRRSVELTAAGEEFVRRGRDLLNDAHNLLVAVNGTASRVRIDVISEGLTGSVIARELRPILAGVAIEVVQGQGLAAAVPSLLDGRVDVAFGWIDGIGNALPARLSHRVVRWEAVGVLLPAEHPLARFEQVPVSDLASYPLLLHSSPEAREWRAWARQAVRAFDLRVGHVVHGHGPSSHRDAVVEHRAPSFGPVDGSLFPGVVCRSLVDPRPLMPISVVWRAKPPSSDRLDSVLRAVEQIAAARGWTAPPAEGDWLPEEGAPLRSRPA